MSRYRDPQLQWVKITHICLIWDKKLQMFNPLSPHDASKHHLASLKTDLISQQPRVLERKFP